MQKACGAGLDEDHVDRVAGGVVQVAGDAGPLLGRRQAPLAFGLVLGPQRALLQLSEPLSAQSRPVAGEPGGCPDESSEEELGREPVTDKVRPEENDQAPHEHGRPNARARLVAVVSGRVECDREADRRAEAVSEPVERCGRSGHESKDGERREPAASKRQ
jgi:hypothetical protein